MRSSVCIESAIVVQNVYEIKLVAYSDIIIIWIVRGSDLHSTCPEGHINDDVVRDYWNTTVYEGMGSKLAVEVLERHVSGHIGLRISKMDYSLYNVHH